MSGAACATAGQSLFELHFNASGLSLPVDALIASNGTNPTLFAVTVPSNGTVIQSYDRHEEFVDSDGSLDVSLCLPAAGCYGLVDFTGLWPEDLELEDRYRVRWNGTDLKGSLQLTFPYYLVSDADRYTGIDTVMSFTEFGGGCSLKCGTNESLFEVQIWAGNTGASHSWRLEDVEGREVMGCDDDGGGGTGSRGCGTAYDVRVSRACLPAPSGSCYRFLYGNPNLVATELSFTSDRNPMYTMTSTKGASNPRFVVAVDGSFVSDALGGFLDGSYGTVVNFGSVEIGNSCPKCPENTRSLLEVFTYRTRQSPTLSISLSDLLGPASGSQNLSVSSNSLQYARQCLPPSGCYDIQVSIPESAGLANRSYYESVPTVVKLDSVYYANQNGLFDASTGEYSYSLALGAGCTKDAACAANESLVTVHIDTTQQMEYTPIYFGLWFLYDASNPPDIIQPYEFTINFDRGYPAGSHFQHLMCAPDGVPTMFGMFDSVPLAVTWSVKTNDKELSCRQTSEGNTNRPYLDEVISTPLDGSCPASSSSLSAGAIAGIVIGAVAAAALALLLVRRHYSYGKGRTAAPAEALQQDDEPRRGNQAGGKGASASDSTSVAEESPPAPCASTTEVAF